MYVRQMLEPVDVFGAVPDATRINPNTAYVDSLRNRLNTVGGRGQFASDISTRDANNRLQQAYEQRLAALRPASGLGGQGVTSAALPWDGKKWFDITGGKYKYSGTFGKYASGGEHNALDFLTPLGSKLYMPFGGKIVSAGFEPQKTPGGKYFGNAIRIKFDNGTYGILGHLGSFAQGLKPGQHFNAGSFLGLSGNTGYSTGPHTHFEMRTSLYNPSTAFDYRYLFGW